MDEITAGLRALAELRDLKAGLADEFASKARTWVAPHERNGRPVAGYWREDGTSSLARAVGDVVAAEGERPAWDPPLHPEIRAKIDKEGLNDWPPKKSPGGMAEQILGSYKDTQEQHSRMFRGKRYYSRARSKEHKRIISKFLKGHKPQDEKVALFMAGGVASGKTTALRAAEGLARGISVPDPVQIGADDIKEEMEDYKRMIDAGDKYAGSAVHEESADIVKMLTEESKRRGLNFIIDGTGNSSLKTFMDVVEDAKDNDYQVKLFFVDLPTNVAIERAVRRAEGDGRYIAESQARLKHTGAAANHLMWRTSDKVDEFQVWSMNVPQGQEPVLAAHGGKGKYMVDDDYEYSRIEQKGVQRTGATRVG